MAPPSDIATAVAVPVTIVSVFVRAGSEFAWKEIAEGRRADAVDCRFGITARRWP